MPTGQTNGCSDTPTFVEAATRAFGFMDGLGYEVVKSSPALVRFSNGSRVVQIYHGRRSREVGIEFGDAEEAFSMQEVLRAVGEESAESYRNPVAISTDQIATAVQGLAERAQHAGLPALQGEQWVYDRLRNLRKEWGETFSMDVLSRQLRPRAEAAFRDKQYAEAVDLYERILPRLTPAELAKLEFARRHRR